MLIVILQHLFTTDHDDMTVRMEVQTIFKKNMKMTKSDYAYFFIIIMIE